jgi:hypothetical protein
MAKRRSAGRSGTKGKGAKRDLPVRSAGKVKGQGENLVFTSVSNVLKTRHDTAKNSINNVR